jgi:hypothetical protein
VNRDSGTAIHSLKTRVRTEADKKVNAMNETERVPSISLGLARVYLNATDPKLATRTPKPIKAAFCRRLMVAMTGAPQCGHVRAWSLTCPLHS